MTGQTVTWQRTVAVALACVVLWGCGTGPEPAPRLPNFIVIFIDDMGYGDIGPFGSTLNRTPNLDRIADEGMKLTSFYAAPLCTPSRAALLTGCYPKRVGLEAGSWFVVLMPGDEHGIHSDEVTVAEILRSRGYRTACIGKWHLGDQPEFLPTRHGFDYYYGLPYSNDMIPDNPHTPIRNYPPLPLLRGEEVLSTYRFNTQTAQHTFCSLCGIKSFYVPRSHPDGYSVNARCLDEATVRSLRIDTFDGRHWEDNVGQLPGR